MGGWRSGGWRDGWVARRMNGGWMDEQMNE
jgi:hypothetical protein